MKKLIEKRADLNGLIQLVGSRQVNNHKQVALVLFEYFSLEKEVTGTAAQILLNFTLKLPDKHKDTFRLVVTKAKALKFGLGSSSEDSESDSSPSISSRRSPPFVPPLPLSIIEEESPRMTTSNKYANRTFEFGGELVTTAETKDFVDSVHEFIMDTDADLAAVASGYCTFYAYQGLNAWAIRRVFITKEKDKGKRLRDLIELIVLVLSRGTTMLLKPGGKMDEKAFQAMKALAGRYDIVEKLNKKKATQSTVTFSRIVAAHPEIVFRILQAYPELPRPFFHFCHNKLLATQVFDPI